MKKIGRRPRRIAEPIQTARRARASTPMVDADSASLCSCKDAATRLGLTSSKSVYNLCRRGVLDSRKSGGRRLIVVASVDALAGPVETVRPQLCSRKSAAARLKMSPSKVISLCDEGVLRLVRCGGRRLIDIATIDAFARRGEAQIERLLNEHRSGETIDAHNENGPAASIASPAAVEHWTLSPGAAAFVRERAKALKTDPATVLEDIIVVERRRVGGGP